MRPRTRHRGEPLGRNFRRLLPAAFAANLGDGVAKIAVPWLATALTRDPLLISLIVLATRLPWLFLSLPAGVIADRVDRRRLIVCMDLLRAVAVGGFAVVVLAHQGHIPDPEAVEAGLAEPPANAAWLLVALYLMALIVGCSEVLRDNAAQTLLPSLVRKRQLQRANSRLWGAEITADSFIGPPIAGVLLGVALVVPFGFTGLLFAVAGLLMLTMRGRFSARGAPEVTPATATSWRADLREGIRWLWQHRLLRTLAISLGIMNAAMTAAFANQVLFAQEILHLDATGFGILLTGAAVGALLGSFVSEHITTRTGDGVALRLMLLVSIFSFAGIGLSSHPAPVWILLAVSGLFIVVWNVVTVSLRQSIIPDHLLGRVNSVYRFFGWGMMSVGALAGGIMVTVGEGIIGREWALRAPYLVAALCCVALIPYLWNRASSAEISTAMSRTDDR